MDQKIIEKQLFFLWFFNILMKSFKALRNALGDSLGTPWGAFGGVVFFGLYILLHNMIVFERSLTYARKAEKKHKNRQSLRAKHNHNSDQERSN